MQFSREQKIYLLLNFVVIIGLCTSAITAAKTVDLGFVFPCSNIFFSLLTFPITDIISEIWGKEYAKKTVWISFFGQTLFVLFIQGSIFLPSASFGVSQEAYETILGVGPRILLASLIAYITSQIWDVVVYDKLKSLTSGRYIWLRNNISTFTSQFINSSLFIFIAFYGTQPVLQLIFGSILLKWFIALIDTPLVYLGIHYIRNKLGDELKQI